MLANRMARVDIVGSFEKLYYYQNDRLGTPKAITNEANEAVWEASFSPTGYANVSPLGGPPLSSLNIACTSEYFDDMVSQNSTVPSSFMVCSNSTLYYSSGGYVNSYSSITNNFRFPGQYYDEETGLHYNWNRYYDPSTGRYITPDPIGLAGGLNLYLYAGGNPVNAIDPKGLKPPQYIPEDADITSNACMAKKLSWPEFINNVKTDGDWDYKKDGHIEYEPFGNYHFGVISAARGTLELVTKMGAGGYQGYSDHKNGGLKNVQWHNYKDFLDDPRDQYWISEGYKDFMSGMYNSECECP